MGKHDTDGEAWCKQQDEGKGHSDHANYDKSDGYWIEKNMVHNEIYVRMGLLRVWTFNTVKYTAHTHTIGYTMDDTIQTRDRKWHITQMRRKGQKVPWWLVGIKK